AGIRSAINAASGNTGVQATLINESGGSRLVLTSTTTGEDGAMKIAQSGGDGGLAALVYDPQGTMAMTELAPAQQAHIRIGTFDVFSSSNTIADAIDGVTVNLKDTTAGDTVSLTIGNDTNAVSNKIKGFVNAYNTLYTTFAKLRSYNADTKEAGPMLGDALLQGIEEGIRTDLVSPVSDVSSAYNSLAALGITKQVDGTLKVDDTKLSAALSADRGAVAAVFGSTNGVAARLYTRVDAALATNSGIDARNTRLQGSMKDINQQKADLDARMAGIETRYRAQFGALDVMLSQMQQTSNYLAQQLANLPKSG